MVRGAGIEPARSFEQQILSLSRLPITTPAHVFIKYIIWPVNVLGGADEICTRVRAFAELCLTPRPPRLTTG